jgi:hypothetical protein
MAKVKDKVQNSLDEARMLILGSQVLLGFQLKSAFESGFEKLPIAWQFLKMGGLVALVVAAALLMAPAAYHQIVERGEDTERLHAFATRVAALALLPFAAALGVDGYVGAAKVGGHGLGLAFGLGTAATALFMWYGLEAIARRSHAPHGEEEDEMSDEERGGTKLKDKIKQVLTEARVVLPGAQALLGFQFIAILMESFDRQPKWIAYTHLASLGFVALATILLMTPAAYHRLVEEGENSEHFHRTASRLLLAAMVVLPLGVCGDVFVVVHKVTDDFGLALGAAVGLLALCYGLWFGYTAYRRAERGRPAAARRRSEAGAPRHSPVGRG